MSVTSRFQSDRDEMLAAWRGSRFEHKPRAAADDAAAAPPKR